MVGLQWGYLAKIPDSDDDNKVVDEYDLITQHDTVQPEHGPFQNYVVIIIFRISIAYDFWNWSS
jgi:hypothetical protein